ncbi:TetR/AcrR family transcriptional regulator [Desulfosporosinus meridiei]|uniref:Transcriptional regulator n=1 Tax=Desulfosporosinus meridiei (strain ATCC BAA-275 / DSM 13257 / KCTC 12902 / NCIMB 13706 / S10) TaxID=768704 RepID=J7IWI0_DESMD|nr:TetR/AcrR family transcriptional regulator [Desulfosporosinus meridiei]AFQ44509.1 transcriptional regulator [Desulfosporosinus meridiei DSM 13257]
MCTTEDKIIDAAIVLFSQKGYTAVTTKEIAKEAGVSEMTLFRHFENKHNLFERAFDRFVFTPKFIALFENLEWNLERDLFNICSSYQDVLRKNQKIILMHLKNDEFNPQFEKMLSKFPNEFKNLLSSYFEEMRNRGVIVENPETLAVSFLATNFGLFFTSLVMSKLTFNTDLQTCISNYVKIFTKGISLQK